MSASTTASIFVLRMKRLASRAQRWPTGSSGTSRPRGDNLHTSIRLQKSFVAWVLARQAVMWTNPTIRVRGLCCDDSPRASGTEWRPTTGNYRRAAPQNRTPSGAPAGGDAVILWNARVGEATTKACIAPLDDPFHESRMYAMMHIAIHDALNAIDRRFRPYTFDKRAEPGASPDAAVAAAARDVLVPLLDQLPRLPFITQSCVDAGVASVEAAYTAALAALPDTPAKAQGIAVGKAAAAAILALRATDGP